MHIPDTNHPYEEEQENDDEHDGRNATRNISKVRLFHAPLSNKTAGTGAKGLALFILTAFPFVMTKAFAEVWRTFNYS